MRDVYRHLLFLLGAVPRAARAKRERGFSFCDSLYQVYGENRRVQGGKSVTGEMRGKKSQKVRYVICQRPFMGPFPLFFVIAW